METYQIINSENGLGKCLIIKSNWDNSFIDIIRKNSIEHLRLSSSIGWKDKDISFVRDLKNCNLRGIEIYNWDVSDLSPIEELIDLCFIGFEANLKENIDLSTFKNLKIFKARWSKKIINIHRCEAIESMNIINYPFEDLSDLKNIQKLKSLSITSNKLKTLKGISFLKDLKIIDLYNCTQIEDIQELNQSHALEKIAIEKCKKLVQIPDLAQSKKIQEVSLNDCGGINSITSIGNCTLLRSVYFVGDTNILDGEISFLEKMPNLQECWFANRKHYNTTRERLSSVIKSHS